MDVELRLELLLRALEVQLESLRPEPEPSTRELELWMETLLMDVELGLEQLLKGLEVQPGSLLLELEL